MKTLLTVLLIFIISQNNYAQNKASQPVKSKTQVVEASCGQCQFGMKGKSCDLAVRINGKTYFVDGSKIDDHGDSHAKDGFCQMVRKAEVSGKVVNGRFLATHFRLLPEKSQKED